MKATVLLWAPARSQDTKLLRIAVCLQLSIVVAAFCSSVPGSAQEMRINEFMAINRHGLTDEDGDTSDWLELYNPSSNAVSLLDWYLTDDASDLRKWQFPNVSVPGGGYLVVFASGKDRRTPAAQLHTNFQLDGDGEYLALVQSD